ncbi:MAG: nicotinamide phosphoribosyltransferase domain-containing protein [Bacilli bacterium]
MGYSSILKTDFYKITHMQQYNSGITHITSYLTPRGSRFDTIDKMVVFGIANFVNEVLYKDFNENFFGKQWLEIYEDLTEVLINGLHSSVTNLKATEDKIHNLHKLGYLPIEINGLPEGTLCPMGVPAIEIRSTHPNFAWVAQSIESILSCEFWHPAISATIAREYKKIVKAAYNQTVGDEISHMGAMCDFSMRGQESYASAVASGAAFLTSFFNCSTIESRRYVNENYNDKKPVMINGLTSTEHSVMCSDFAICGDERETFRRLLTEVYPNTSFAAVCDSYDFWNVVTNILPSLRNEIEEHNGFIGIRHDCYTDTAQLLTQKGWKYIKDITVEDKVAQFEKGIISFVNPLKIINEPYKGDMYRFYNEKFDINTIVTPNHRMVRYNKRKNEYQVVKADKACYYDGMGLVRNGLLKGEISELTPLEKLYIAYQADGYCTKSCLNKTEQFESGYTIKFQFSKEKKIKHLIQICEEGNFEYWIREGYKPHKSSQKNETEICVKIFEKPIKRLEDWIDLTDKNEKWCKNFIEEMSYWDCRIRKDCPYIYEYVNTNIIDAQIVQTIGALAGYNTHFSLREDNREDYYLDCCYVTINKKNNIPCYTVHKERIEDYDGNIYCVNVPSGQLVVRDNEQIFISGNSSEPVHALCGIQQFNFNKIYSYNEDIISITDEVDFEDFIYEFMNDNYPWTEEPFEAYFEYTAKSEDESHDGQFFSGVYQIIPTIWNISEESVEKGFELDKLRDSLTYEDKGMVETFYELFGGSVNSKGFIQINPKVKAVYGDSITLPRATEIYRRLASKGFAANNVSLGVGSFSMECIEESDGSLKPFTRDSFSIAIKATYCIHKENGREKEIFIYKDPKGCEGKKSLRGLCRVVENYKEIKVVQELNKEQYDSLEPASLFVNYFKNGEVTKYSFEDVRERLEDNI